MQFNLQSGSFNKRMLLQTETSASDGCGGFTSLWDDVGEYWAKLVPQSSERAQNAAGLQVETTHEIYVRNGTPVKSGMRFVHDQRLLDIITVHDPDETGRYLLCKAKEYLE